MSGSYSTEIVNDLHPYARRTENMLFKSQQDYRVLARIYKFCSWITKYALPLIAILGSLIFSALNPHYAPLTIGGLYLLLNPTIDLYFTLQLLASNAISEAKRCREIRERLTGMEGEEIAPIKLLLGIVAEENAALRDHWPLFLKVLAAQYRHLQAEIDQLTAPEEMCVEPIPNTADGIQTAARRRYNLEKTCFEKQEKVLKKRLEQAFLRFIAKNPYDRRHKISEFGVLLETSYKVYQASAENSVFFLCTTEGQVRRQQVLEATPEQIENFIFIAV